MAPSRCSSCAVALPPGGCVSGREKLGGAEYRCGGGGGVAGARGMTLGDAATDAAGASGAADVTGPDGSGGRGGADVTTPDGAAGAGDGGTAGVGLRSGGGGGERSGPGGTLPGKMPRDDGGGGMRDVGTALPNGRGTTLTGRGTAVAPLGSGATTPEAAVSEALEALGSLSSPIENLAAYLAHHARQL